jgi:drug/metabolite transporter (DMT)-like permease
MGLSLILLTGLVWGGIGVVLATAVRRNLNPLAFMTVATVLGCLASWPFLVKWSPILSGNVQRPLSLVLLLCTGGAAGIVGMLYLQKSMKAGAAAWTVGQSAMVIPFLVGILFLGEPMRIGGGLGLTAIVLSLIAFSLSEQTGEKKTLSSPGSSRQSWLRQALLAFVFLGIQGTCSSLPSSWEGWSDIARLRVPLIMSSGAIPLVLAMVHQRLWPQRSAWALALLYAALVIAGQLLLFASLDQLRYEGRLSLAFPLALGTCITVVAIWDILIWRNRPQRWTTIGISFGLLGIVLLAW